MSSLWKKPNYTPRQQERHWMNLIYGTHDQFCDCGNVNLHFLTILNKDSSAPKPESEIRNIQCLLTGKTTGETEEQDLENGGFIEGELERLFKEEDGEKEDTDSTTR